jgi:glycosyltransferase involved in cell wall biosynthesis/spore maturation protein CgeB/SAM-dependent methyltransferase
MEAYEGKLGDEFMRETKARTQWICSKVEGERILDLSYSQGAIAIVLARVGHKVTILENSREAIDESKRDLCAEPQDIQDKIAYLYGDLVDRHTSMPRSDSIIFSSLGCHAQPSLVLENAAALLKHGGRIVVAIPNAMNISSENKPSLLLSKQLQLIGEYFQLSELKIEDQWLGIVASKIKADKLQPIPSAFLQQKHCLEHAFESVERQLTDRLSVARSEAEILEGRLTANTAALTTMQESHAQLHAQWAQERQQLEHELSVSKVSLSTANSKYRTITGEQIPHLKANLTQLIERNSNQQRRIDELKINLERANAQRHLAEQRLIKTRASLTYQAGYQLRNSAGSLTDLVKLPVRLLYLVRKAQQLRAKAKQKLLKQEDVPAPLPVPPNPSLHDEKHLQMPAQLPESEQSRANLMRSVDAPATQLRVACIMDEFTFGSYRYECDLQPLTPKGWKSELDAFKPELLFIESAWRGKDDLWGNKVGHNSQELQDIIGWCRDHSVPTVFWNKEDPVHFETFLTTAKQFDHVFTTDIDCIHRYKGALGHERVYLLPFACQPALHNPIELYERKDAFCFAGAYYVRYPERTRDLANFVCELPKFRPLEIFDRNYGKNDTNYQFPAEYQPYIVGTLPFEKIDTAYKGYRYAINLNSIKQSQSMFARRIFELLACNTSTISNFSRGVRLMFGDLVTTTDNGEEVLRKLQQLASDPQDNDKVRLAALRKVMLEHTYSQRLGYVLSKVNKTPRTQRLPEIAIVAEAKNRQQYQLLRDHLDRQEYNHARMYIVSEMFDSSIVRDDPRIEIIKRKQLQKTTLGDLFGDTAWIAYFNPNDYYGPNYLMDLALATRYSRAKTVGKAAHFAWNGHSVDKLQSEQSYRPVLQLSARRSMIAIETLAAQPVLSWLKSAPHLQYEYEHALAIDPFNYCENGAGLQQPLLDKFNDLKLDTGLSIDQLQARAESIAPLKAIHDASELSGRQLAEFFGITRNKFLDLSVDVDNWRIHSKLADGKHEYVYALQEASVDILNCENGKFKLFLDAAPGLNLQLVILFLDADKQRISHVMLPANRNHTADLPPETAFIRFGIRAYASGSTEIKALVVGHRNLQPSEMLGRAEHLLLTNHYPTYDDLYRNGFVHSRVSAYQNEGVKVDVFRLRSNEAVSYHEFNNVDVVTGCQATLEKMLEKGRYKSILVHFLDDIMWKVLAPYLDSLRVTVWVHGAEIQPWWRRQYNYVTDEQLSLAKLASEKRMTFWREVLKPMHENLKLVFVSHYFADEVMEDLGFRLPEEQFEIIHNPIDTDLFAYKKKTAAHRKKILSIRPYTSRTYANDLSVKAIQLLAQKPWFSELEFRMIGDGQLFEEILSPLRGYDNVKIERGFLSHAEIAELHKDYGVFLCPSRMDTQGVSRDEAMASGLVPVTTAIAAIPEFVDAQSGCVVEGENAEQLAKALELLYSDEALFLRKSQAAAQRVRDQSDGKKMAILELKTFQDV